MHVVANDNLALRSPGHAAATCTRLTLRGAQLQAVGGTLFVRASGLELGRAPVGLIVSALTTLTITSSSLDQVDGDLVGVYSGPCGHQFLIHEMGLRHMGA